MTIALLTANWWKLSGNGNGSMTNSPGEYLCRVGEVSLQTRSGSFKRYLAQGRLAMKVTLMGLFLVALVLATASQAIAGIGYGILWHNVTTGRFGVWQVSDHGSVSSAYDLTVDNPPWDSNPIYDEQRVPNTLHTYYYFCGANVLDPVTHKPYDPVGCSNTSTYSITELFPQRAGGFDFLYYNYLQGGISPQFADFTGKVTIPGHPLRNWNGTAAECDAASGCSADWKMVGTGTFDQSGGAPSILWYNARAGQLRVWKISTLDLRTVIDKVDWSACGGSCAAYGTPVGAADF